MVLEEWDPEDNSRPIVDPRSWTNQGKYSAPGPNANVLWPEGVGPFEWVKMYCWEESVTENVPMDTAEVIASVAGVMFIWPLIYAITTGFQVSKSYIVKKCHFVKYDNNGNKIDEEDREVERRPYPQTPLAMDGPTQFSLENAVNTADFIPTSAFPTEDESSAKEKTLSKIDKEARDNLLPEPGPDETRLDIKELSLFAADINPNDVVEYFLVPRTAANPAGGYFTKVDFQVRPGDVLSGKQLKQYSFLKSVDIDSAKMYKLIEITPNTRQWRYTKNYKLGKLPFSMVSVKVVEAN